jgi:AraC-like DNA-binding protein
MENFGMVEANANHYYASNRAQWVLHLCLSGRGFVKTNGVVTPVQAPALVALCPQTFHEHWAHNARPWLLFHWFLRNDGDTVSHVLKDLGLGGEVTPLCLTNIQKGSQGLQHYDLRLAHLLNRLMLVSGEASSDIYLKYALMMEFHSVLSRCSLITAGAEPVSDLVKRAEFILLNLADSQLNANSLASRLGVGRATLTRHLHQAGLPPPGEWITQKRMLHASKLLKQSPGITLKHLAASCGYADAAYFCRVFTKRHGKSPMRYK